MTKMMALTERARSIPVRSPLYMRFSLPTQKEIIFAEKVVREIDEEEGAWNRRVYRRRQDDRYRIL